MYRGEAILEFIFIFANPWLFKKLADTCMKLSATALRTIRITTHKKMEVLQSKTEWLHHA